MKIIMLGTGNALVTECYNTCFLIEDNNERLLVDGGGGNGVLSRLKSAEIDYKSIHNIFVTHKHIDHILGIIWIIRMITQSMAGNEYEGDVYVYGHDEVIRLIREMSENLLRKKETNFFDNRINFITVLSGETKNIIGHKFTFFDINSEKAKQYGFVMDDKKLACCGDEPYNLSVKEFVQNAEWLLHEAFCLSSQADIFDPYEKKHSTVKDACIAAEKLKVKNLILYHTEDRNIINRKDLYLAEANQYFSGNVIVPDDLDIIEIK